MSEPVQLCELIRDLFFMVEQKDFSKLSQEVHPIHGARFTPSEPISFDDNKVIDHQSFLTFFSDETVDFWGNLPSTVFKIDMSSADYYDNYIYEQDYHGGHLSIVDDFSS